MSNGGGELVDQSLLLEQQEQLVKDRKELKEEVTVLSKKLEDLKMKNNVSLSHSVCLSVSVCWLSIWYLFVHPSAQLLYPSVLIIRPSPVPH